MKSKTSFFDKTVLKKDLTRFSPLWALYLIGGLLIMHLFSGFLGSYYNGREVSIAQTFNKMIGPMGIFSGVYGFLTAQLLFGDLHNTRLCYGVHAFPLRRERWYLTHVASGLLIGLVPPLVIILTLMPMANQFWFTGLLCFSGLALHYLFFFALATFCMMCTGNRSAATLVYGLLNFLSMIIHWFATTIYIPLLPGVRANTSIFNRFSPLVELSGRDDFFRIQHVENCKTCRENLMMPDFLYDANHEYAFEGLGGDWMYLLILAVVGIGLLGGALLLYRIRHLERAGDFMAFKPMKPMFLTVYSMCVGGVLFLLAEEVADRAVAYLFFGIGLAIGYFTGKMMLERTIRVFHRKSLIGMGILYGAVVVSLLLTWVDPIGISRRIPKSDQVEVVYLYDGYLSDYQLNNPDRMSTNSNILAVTDPEDIAGIGQTHRLMLQEHQTDDYMGSRWFTLQYQMKNGSTVSRSYRIQAQGEAWTRMKPYMTHPEYLFGVPSLEELLQKVSHVYSQELGQIPESMWPELLKALWLDAQQGYLFTNGSSIGAEEPQYVELRLSNQYRALFYNSKAPHLNQWMQQHRTSPTLLLQYESLEALQNSTKAVYCPEYDLELYKSTCDELLELLWQDCKNGLVTSSTKWSDGIYVEVETAQLYLSLHIDSKSESAKYLQLLAAILK